MPSTIDAARLATERDEIRFAYLFGSVARNEAESSDIDVAVFCKWHANQDHVVYMVKREYAELFDYDEPQEIDVMVLNGCLFDAPTLLLNSVQDAEFLSGDKARFKWFCKSRGYLAKVVSL